MSASSELNPTTPLAPLAAPVLLGSLFNWGLFGILSVQVYLYHIAFQNDRWVAKSLVYGIYILDIAQTFIVTSDVFNAYAKQYGDVGQLTAMQNEWLAVPVFSSIVSCTVQIYYAYRIGFLSRSRSLMAVISMLALMQGIAGIITGVQAFLIGSFNDLESKAHTTTIVWLAGSAACDVLIAVTMAVLLQRKDTNSPETRAIITKLVHLVIETGTLTAFAATLLLILYVAVPNRAYYSCVGAVLAKLYSNSLLVLFNSRMRVSSGRDDDSRTRTRASMHGAVHVLSPRAAAESLASGIHVQEQVWVHADEIPMEQKSCMDAAENLVITIA